MAVRLRVECIRKRDRQNPHERIQGIGGYSLQTSGRWYKTEEEAIAGIRSRNWSFYVSVNSREVDVIVASHNGRDYLKTTADGYAPNNLLSLPECP